MSSVTITVAVDDVDAVLESYDVIEVHRSVTGPTGTYVNLTNETKISASLTGSNDAPFTLNGLTLQIRVDGGEVQSATIEEADPVQIDPLVAELSDAFEDVTVSNGGTGNIKFTSNRTGTESVVEIYGGTALTALGLSTSFVSGQDRYVPLVSGYTEFTFTDNAGAASYYYKVRYLNTDTGVTSAFSDPIIGEQSSPISSELITATIDLVDMRGNPLVDTIVVVSNTFVATSLTVSGYGMLGASTEFNTDASGHGEVQLVKGSIVDVSITGTGITRRIVVPSSGTSFDLLAAVAAADDVFQIQTPDIPNAIRRS